MNNINKRKRALTNLVLNLMAETKEEKKLLRKKASERRKFIEKKHGRKISRGETKYLFSNFLDEEEYDIRSVVYRFEYIVFNKGAVVYTISLLWEGGLPSEYNDIKKEVTKIVDDLKKIVVSKGCEWVGYIAEVASTDILHDMFIHIHICLQNVGDEKALLEALNKYCIGKWEEGDAYVMRKVQPKNGVGEEYLYRVSLKEMYNVLAFDFRSMVNVRLKWSYVVGERINKAVKIIDNKEVREKFKHLLKDILEEQLSKYYLPMLNWASYAFEANSKYLRRKIGEEEWDYVFDMIEKEHNAGRGILIHVGMGTGNMISCDMVSDGVYNMAEKFKEALSMCGYEWVVWTCVRVNNFIDRGWLWFSMLMLARPKGSKKGNIDTRFMLKKVNISAIDEALNKSLYPDIWEGINGIALFEVL